MFLASKHKLRLPFRNEVSFYFHEKIGSALTIGFWKPIIVFPLALVNTLTIEETEALILHELQHIKNNDFIILRGISLINNLFFFNPFIYLLRKNTEADMESSCDHAVLLKHKDMINYAVALQKTAAFAYSHTNSETINAIGKKGKIAHRISQFPSLIKMDTKSNLPFWTFFAPAVLVLCITFHSKQTIQSFSPVGISSTSKMVMKSPPTSQKGYYKLPNNIYQVGQINPKGEEKENHQQQDEFQTYPQASSFLTGYDNEENTKQITIEEESSGTGIRTTSSFLVLNENGTLQNTWLWSVEETIETTDSIYSDTLVQFHEYVEDLR